MLSSSCDSSLGSRSVTFPFFKTVAGFEVSAYVAGASTIEDPVPKSRSILGGRGEIGDFLFSLDEVYDGTFDTDGAGAGETGGVLRASFFFPPPARRAKSLLMTSWKEVENEDEREQRCQNVIVHLHEYYGVV